MITVIWPTTFDLIIQSYLYMVFVYERIIFNLLISLCFINEYKQWIYVSRYHRVQLGSGDVGQTRFHLRLGFRSTIMSSSVVENVLSSSFSSLTYRRVYWAFIVWGRGKRMGFAFNPRLNFMKWEKMWMKQFKTPQGTKIVWFLMFIAWINMRVFQIFSQISACPPLQ